MIVLLVNDNRDEIGLFAQALKHVDSTIGFEYAFDEADAMGFIASNPARRPDIVFLNENHFLLLEKLRSREEFGSIRVTVYTNSTDPDHIDRALALDASLFPKPNSYRNLIILLKRRFEKMARV